MASPVLVTIAAIGTEVLVKTVVDEVVETSTGGMDEESDDCVVSVSAALVIASAISGAGVCAASDAVDAATTGV